ncbi:mannonate dehydratase [Actinopolymorpha singaporensis]|uniref:mannonate dehydratase n=1 Tax=Actinopolymorpha singaporensis TaxID=117157 RepID=A0A1H1UR57_9ACTN|nr:mannonate dehydratase [Actinopolymorpha singaporensis]SDS74965.1 mannonate dehydratase [Actinopolymorpha singaporensis]
MTIRVIIGQLNELDDETALFARQLGIDGVQFNTPRLPADQGFWQLDDLVALRRRCADAGLHLEALENVPMSFYDKVLTGAPGRERQLENFQRTVRNVAAAGIPILGYHFMPTFVWRTSVEPGRGGALVTAFDESRVADGNLVDYPQVDPSLRIGAEQMWDNYRTFCEAVMPVAEECGIRLALHPDDPPVEAIGGVARLFNSPANFRRAYELAGRSEAWAIDLCLGTTSEMAGGAAAVEDMIDYFVPRGRVAYVHFRDVQGTVPAFCECFLGEGNYDPPAVMRRLVAAGFDGFLLDDHVPRVVNDTEWGHRARAHAIGYIQALLAVHGG